MDRLFLLMESSMSKLMLGAVCGIVWGALSAASMIPLAFSDKRAALLGAFLNRFAIGFVLGVARLPVPSWLNGLIFGVLLSLPDAIITKAYAPILVLGAIGGVVISLIVGKWGSRPLPSCLFLREE
jgi:hypothetical protein